MKDYVARKSEAKEKSNGEAPIKKTGHSQWLSEIDSVDVMIEPDSELGKWLGFTQDKFDGYMWKKNDQVYVSFLVSKKPNEGNLSKLFGAIHKNGWTIKVPTPLGNMESILYRKGFKNTVEYDELSKNYINVWIQKPHDMETNRQQSDADCANTP